MRFNSFEDLLIDELQDLYSAENQLIQALPKMEKAASNLDLKKAFKDHLEETKLQAKRLEKCFQLLNTDGGKIECEAMKGLIFEGKEIIDSGSDPLLIDAGLIGAAQKVEHYEIAGYGTAIAHAKMLELDDIAELLDESIEEESNANKLLTKIAEGGYFSSGINEKASKH